MPEEHAASAPPPAPPPAAAAPAPAPRRRRWLRGALLFLASIAALLAILLAAGAWWIGSDRSLAFALAQAARHLPAGQSLEAREVSGSLRAGGRIGWLRWQSETLAVELHDARIGWRLAPLLKKRLELGQAHIARLVIERRGPGEDKPPEPLTQLVLPIDIDLPWRIDELRWTGPPALEARALAGRYRYADARHSFVLDGADIAHGHYSARATLQGPAPMALEAAIDGRVRAPLAQERGIDLTARARIDGTLAGAGARLALQADLQSEAQAAPPGAQTKTQPPAQAQARASIAPWSRQPLIEASATWRELDLAPLWPQAPTTRLHGRLDIQPDGAAAEAWKGRVELRNAAPGPWDTGRLPIDSLRGDFAYADGGWTLSHSLIEAGGGRIEAQGQWRPAPQPWQAQATLQRVQPGALLRSLAGAPVRGRIEARQDAGEGMPLAFDLDLQADGAAPAALPPGLRLRRLAAQGQWQAKGTLELARLQLLTEHARLEGRASLDLTQQAGNARLALDAPGARARLEGRLAPAQGGGTLDAQVTDAWALQQWLRRLPGLSDALDAFEARGQARLDARWQGGWRAIANRLSNADTPAPRAAEPTLQATLEAPQLELRQGAPSGAAEPLRLSGVRAELAGSLAQATLSLRGEAAQGERRLALETRASGGLERARQWHIAVANLRAQLATDARAAPWILTLPQGVNATIRSTPGANPRAAATLDVQASAAGATLTGPVPGTVRIDWEPLRLTRTGEALRLQSRGHLRGLPMAWAQAAGGGDALRDIGASGDLVFDGDWDIDATDALRAQVRLARRSGDIRVHIGEAALVTRIRSTGTGSAREIETDAQAGTGTPAGLRQAELRLSAEGQTLRATLAWDSERAGSLQAEASTRLARDAAGWRWPEDAPLAGQVRARLPQLGVWSMLAPPGWRIAGTLAADATLAGNRAAPRWNGTLSAEQLALRAVVEGLDLRDGRLRASLAGERLVLEEFTLRGGPASRVRIPGRSGNLSTAASEAASDGGSLSVRGEMGWGGGGNGIRAALQGRLEHLRVLARSDRQLTLSGTLGAQLDQGQITVRGQLQADRAAIILPSETAPSLGGDVVVHSAAKERAAAEAAKAARTAQGNAGTPDAPSAQVQTRKPPDIELRFDLGRDFAVQGRGITTRLEGRLLARSRGAGMPPQLEGEVRTVAGQYRAYGQQLDIETGVARFSGPFDNPGLDILAIRPNIAQRAGVRITGSAQTPRLALYSEPPLSDAETLSWVILGRAAAANGGEAVLMQQAALALVGRLGVGRSGGSLASRFGLDEIGFRGPGTGGELAASTLSLGKRLTQDFYVTYERSLTGTLGTLFIFYDLTRRLTLRGQAGEHNGLDLIYTVKFD